MLIISSTCFVGNERSGQSAKHAIGKLIGDKGIALFTGSLEVRRPTPKGRLIALISMRIKEPLSTGRFQHIVWKLPVRPSHLPEEWLDDACATKDKIWCNNGNNLPPQTKDLPLTFGFTQKLQGSKRCGQTTFSSTMKKFDGNRCLYYFSCHLLRNPSLLRKNVRISMFHTHHRKHWGSIALPKKRW